MSKSPVQLRVNLCCQLPSRVAQVVSMHTYVHPCTCTHAHSTHARTHARTWRLEVEVVSAHDGVGILYEVFVNGGRRQIRIEALHLCVRERGVFRAHGMVRRTETLFSWMQLLWAGALVHRCMGAFACARGGRGGLNSEICAGRIPCFLESQECCSSGCFRQRLAPRACSASTRRCGTERPRLGT